MKGYESVPRIRLTPRMPIIVRCDGKAFHTFTRGFKKPWDDVLQNAMTVAATALIDEIQGAELAYIQSDEISIVLNTYKYFETQQYFNGNVQKISSVAASITTRSFNKSLWKVGIDKDATFDARCFAIPREEVVNYFIWRQQDAVRNSISGYAQANFSHKDLHKKSTKDMKNMLLEKGLNWENDVTIKNQRGWCVVRETVVNNDVIRTVIKEDTSIPIFSENRDYINKFLVQEEY